jgi:hypothetical protein
LSTRQRNLKNKVAVDVLAAVVHVSLPDPASQPASHFVSLPACCRASNPVVSVFLFSSTFFSIFFLPLFFLHVLKQYSSILPNFVLTHFLIFDAQMLNSTLKIDLLFIVYITKLNGKKG